MRALAAKTYGLPTKYEILDLPTPQITKPNQVLIKVHAASMNPVDVAIANGEFNIAIKVPTPVKIGFDLSGEVAAIGEEVTGFKVGDEVFGCLPWDDRGSISQYALTSAEFLVLKPKNLTHVEAASLPLVSSTALQCFEKVASASEGAFKGKTVFVPGGLSGVGSVACQIAKNVFGAEKVITTVSTGNVSQVHERLGSGVVDQIIDYKTQDLRKEIPAGSIDILLDTTSQWPSQLPLMKKNTGHVITITSTPSGAAVKDVIPTVSYPIQLALNFLSAFPRWRAEKLGKVKYDCVLQRPTHEDASRIGKWAEEGKLKAVVGNVTEFEKVGEVRLALGQFRAGGAGIGKRVVEIVV
ncbi:chaperonin 10-like protein [Tricladium varicosporioides]|nr:chaperonin 10-like protein [Hymenoscyphus varicosporioides]